MERLHLSNSQILVGGETFRQFRRRFDKVIGHEVMDASEVDTIVFLPGIGRDCTYFQVQMLALEKHGIHSLGVNYVDDGDKAMFFEQQYKWTKKILDKELQSGNSIGIVGQSRGGLHAIRYLSEVDSEYSSHVVFAILNSVPVGDDTETNPPLMHLINLMANVTPATYLKVLRRVYKLKTSEKVESLLRSHSSQLAAHIWC